MTLKKRRWILYGKHYSAATGKNARRNLEKIRENGLSDIEAATEALHKMIGKSTCELIQAIPEATDAQIAEALAERKASMRARHSGWARFALLF